MRVSDSVRVRGSDDGSLTLGARAASKLLVEVLAIVLDVLGLAGSCGRADSRRSGAGALRFIAPLGD